MITAGETGLYDGMGTGALWRPADPQNFLMERIQSIADQLAAGYPPDDQHLKEHVLVTYNQGASPSCVSHMTAALMTCNEHIERKQLLIFDAMGLHAATGPPNTGRFPGDILKYAQDNGVAVAQTSQRYRVGSYAFAPTSSPQAWVDTMKAAIASGHVCGLAMRLRSNFGWETSGALLGWDMYHEVLALGYRATPAPWGSFLIKNSWGDGWGQNGFGWVPIEGLLEARFQEGAVIGNTVIDALDGDLAPPPPPPPISTAAVTGQATGAGVSNLAKGQVYTLGTGINLQLIEVKFDQTPTPTPTPPPPPGQLSVTGYSPNPVKAGASFVIQGQGFQGGNLTVLWQDRLLSANRLSDAQIQAVAPSVTGTASAPVTVRVEGAVAEGPALTVSAGDEPTPGDLKVTVTARRYSRGVVGIWAYVQAPGNADLNLQFPPGVEDLILPPVVGNRAATGYVSATASGTINGADIGPPQQQPTATGVPATWQIRNAPSSSTIVITATDDQGRRGQGTASV